MAFVAFRARGSSNGLLSGSKGMMRGIFAHRSTSAFHPITAARSFSSLPPHEKIIMPALSPTMEEGVVASWHRSEGDAFSAGDVLCEIETDKATVDYEMVDDGVLAKILVAAGTPALPVGSTIGVTVEDAAHVAAFANVTIADIDGDSSDNAPPAPAPTPVAPTPAPTPAAAPVVPTPVAPVSTGDRVFASPLARKIARESGLDIGVIGGTGPKGRIVRADVDEYLASGAAATTAQPASSPQAAVPVAGAEQQYGTVGLSSGASSSVVGGSVSIDEAAELTESKRTIPHYYLNMMICVDELLEVRERVNKSSDSPVSLNDFVVRASALAMRKCPQVNSSWENGVIREYKQCDINVSMLQQQGGLVKPVLRGVDSMGVASISKACGELQSKAAVGSFEADDLARGTFTVTNVGAHGVSFATTIVYPHQSATLCVGAVEQRVVPGEEGQGVRVSAMLPVTLSCDHRVVDGAVSAQWLQELRSLLQDPLTMLL